jgi:hypothetical protein
MQDFVASLNLADVQNFLLSGHPSILFQILAVNTIIMMIIIFRRGRGKGSLRRHVSYILQWILILGNLMVVCQEQWMPYVDRGRTVIADHYYRAVRPY